MHDNATYSLRELDGTPLRSRIAGKRIKLFKRRNGQIYDEDLLGFETQDLNQEEEDDVQLEGDSSDDPDDN